MFFLTKISRGGTNAKFAVLADLWGSTLISEMSTVLPFTGFSLSVPFTVSNVQFIQCCRVTAADLAGVLHTHRRPLPPCSGLVVYYRNR